MSDETELQFHAGTDKRVWEHQRTGSADYFFCGALFFDDRTEPKEAEEMAEDAGGVEDRRPRDD
jgi:hypothetical protein